MPGRVLLLASAVGPFGSGITGGVSTFARSSVAALRQIGVDVEVIAPEGAGIADVVVHEVAGGFQPTAASADRPDDFRVPPGSLLAAMLERAHALQAGFDAIVNLNQDWLPVYLTPFFETPLVHVANLSHSNLATDEALRRLARERPGHVAVLSRTQAEALGLVDPPVTPCGLDLDRYRFAGDGGDELAWAGRISPEKGLGDAAEIAARSGRRLAVAGSIEDEAHWACIERRHGEVISYRGFLGTDALQEFLGGARALLQTQSWAEALGVVTLEALACGTPVIAYARGANAELVRHGQTGLLVPPGDIDAAVAAVAEVETISRQACRDYVAQHYSLAALASAYRDWLRVVAAR